MKLTKHDVIKLWNAIEACKEHKNTKFIYSTLRTKKLLADDVEVLTALASPSKKFKEYQKERVELCVKHSTKTAGGAPEIENGEYVFSTSGRVVFSADLDKLKERFADWIEERGEQMDAYDTALKEEVDIDVHQVALMYVPEDLDASVLSGLLPLILEE